MLRKKIIYDNIHQYIEISEIATIIIDSEPFHRLRNINQLGTCSYVFPCANHTRFEHSIGVYYLTGKMVENIIKNNKNNIHINLDTLGETILSERIIELVKIGGLCHDLGHGPYSHVFDDIILASDGDSPSNSEDNRIHEVRSCNLVKKIINDIVNKHPFIINNNMCLSENEIQFIQDIIYPREIHTQFIYQIVSNNINGIDVDKFDYISRDFYNIGLTNGFDYSRLLEDVMIIDDKLCYPKQISLHICNLFSTRYYLHKQILNHKVVKIIEYMLFDIIKLLDPILGIKDSINDLDKFITLTDNYFINFLDYMKNNDNNDNNIQKAQEILYRLRTRQLYMFIGGYTIANNIDGNKIVTYDDFKNINENILEDDVIISVVKIGYVSGNKSNPLDNIYLYDKKNIHECFKFERNKITNFIPNTYQEICVNVYCRMADKYNMILETYKHIENNLGIT
jgi:HD superfamily phosphohydrolase